MLVAAGEVDGALETSHVAHIVPGLAARSDLDAEGRAAPAQATLAALDALVAHAAPDVIHVHTVMRPSVLAWAADHDALVTVQDHRVFCPGQGKWTASGERCDTPMSSEACAGCFEEPTYFRKTLEVTEARLRSVRRMRRVIVLSEYMARELRAVGVSQDRIAVVPPFARGLQLDAEPEAGGSCVLFVGRLVSAKGVWEAVDAWKEAGLGLPLVFAGTGPLRAGLEAEGFEVRGWLDRGALSSLFRRASVLVLPSLWQEPFGIVGLEALAFGVPVAAWDSGGVGEWHPGEGLVRWGDVPALAAAMHQLAGTRAEPKPGFHEEGLMDRLVALYRSAHPSALR